MSFFKRKHSSEDLSNSNNTNSGISNNNGDNGIDIMNSSSVHNNNNGISNNNVSKPQFNSAALDMFVQVLGVDLRSCAAIRFGISLLIMLDLYVRHLYLHDHYTDLGATPTYTVIDANPYLWSLYFINSSVHFARFLFAINFVAAFCLFIGYRTRLANFICWVFMTSLHVRNPMVLNGGDDFFRLIVFWMMFLPLESRFSVDAAMNVDQINRRSNINNHRGGATYSPIISNSSTFPTTDSTGNYYLSFASIGIMAQFCFVYLFTAMLKTGAEWNTEYSSVWYALNLDQFVTTYGMFLRDYVGLGKFLTFASLYWEWYGSLLFFIPLAKLHGPLRTFTVIGFWCLHLGFGTCMELGFFMYIPGMSVLVFLPGWFWDTLYGYIATPVRTSSVIHFDNSMGAVSEHLRRNLSIFKTMFLLNTTPLIPSKRNGINGLDASSEDGISIDQESMMDQDKIYTDMHLNNSWICVENAITLEKVYGYHAFVQLIRLSPVLWVLTPLVTLRIFARAYYWYTGRPSFSNGASLTPLARMYPSKPVTVTRKYWKEIYCFFILLYIVNWNAAGVYDYSVSDTFRWIAPTFKVDQYWSMFSPYPSKEDGWLVIPGILANGQEVDVYNRKYEPVSYDKPALVSPMFPTQRWRKFLMNLQSYHHKDKRLHYGRYLCREWNWFGRNPGDLQLKSFRIMFMLEQTPPMPLDGIIPPDPAPEAVELWSHSC